MTHPAQGKQKGRKEWKELTAGWQEGKNPVICHGSFTADPPRAMPLTYCTPTGMSHLEALP